MPLIGNVNGDIKRNMAFDKMVIDTISFYVENMIDNAHIKDLN